VFSGNSVLSVNIYDVLHDVHNDSNEYFSIPINPNAGNCRRHNYHKSSRRRRGKGKSTKVKPPSTSCMNIAFNNINRVSKKIYEIKDFLHRQDVSIMGMVETFLKDEKYVDVNGYKWYGKNRVQKGGGGIGFLVSSNICVVDDNLFDSKHDEIERLWIKVVTDNRPIFIAVAYFPVNGTDIERTNELYSQLLSDCIRIEEECLNEHVNDPRIIIMADCNGRIGNEIPFCDKEINENGQCLLNFKEDSGLHILNCTKLCKGKFTWFRKDLQSAIDYVLCSDSVLQHVNEFIVDDDRNWNLSSDHNVLLLKCAFRNSGMSSKVCDDEKRITWDIKPNQDWSGFQNVISDKFTDWDNNQFNDINDLWNSWHTHVNQAAKDTIGIRKVNHKLRSWWDKDIDLGIKDRREACKKHRQWCKSEKRDKNIGEDLWNDYQTKRHRVKSLIKDKILQMRVERSIKIAQEGNSHCRSFWTSLRGNNRKQEVYSLKDPGSNEIIYDKTKMKHCVLHYWRTLGKMNRELNDTNNVLLNCNVKEMVRKFRSNHCMNRDNSMYDDKYLHSIDLTIDMVSDAIKSSKNNRAPGIDSITNEMIKNGGDCLTESMFKLFKKIVETNVIPKQWNLGIIIPIFKKGNINDLNNYRGITLTSCVSKIFNRIVANEISKFIEKDNALSEVQGGFRKNYRCEDHIFTLKSITACRRAEGKDTYMAFLDFRKAFDTVWRDGLLLSAWNIGIRGNVWKLIDNLYTDVQSMVKFNDISTEYFDIDEGVKQGCVLSPVLFCIFINEFAKLLAEHKLGVNICDVRIGNLFWADDIVLIANNEHELQKMLDLAATFANSWHLSFNHTKSNVLIVGKKLNPHRLWQLGNDVINEVDKYKYLGVIFSRNMTDHHHIDEVVRKGNRMIGYIKSIIDGQDDFKRVFYGNILWKSLGLSSINYASSVWVPNSMSDRKRLETLQNQMARSILKAPRNTPVECLLGDLGWDTITVLQDKLRVKYLNRLKNMAMHRWPKLLFNVSTFMYSINKNKCFHWLSYVDNVLIECGMDHVLNYWSPNDMTNSWVNSYLNISTDNAKLKWYQNVQSKSSLLNYALLKDKPFLEEYLLSDLDFYASSLKFKARSNTLPLNKRTCAWKNGPDVSLCTLCKTDEEDIKHFMFSCNALNGIRAAEYNNLEYQFKINDMDFIWHLFISSDLNVKLCLMLGLSKDFFNDVYSFDIEIVLRIFDTVCKSFLKKAWNLRNELLK